MRKICCADGSAYNGCQYTFCTQGSHCNNIFQKQSVDNGISTLWVSGLITQAQKSMGLDIEEGNVRYRLKSSLRIMSVLVTWARWKMQ